MKEKLLHTPEGVRDIYNSECKKKVSGGEADSSYIRALRLSGY